LGAGQLRLAGCGVLAVEFVERALDRQRGAHCALDLRRVMAALAPPGCLCQPLFPPADETYLLKKLSMVEAIKKVPTDVSKCIKRINDLRNALAHSFFPANRRRYMAEKKVTYQGLDLFSRAGVLKLREDCDIVYKYFRKKVFGSQ
jgi:hypothetical protein